MAENSRLEANQKNEPHCLQTGFLKSQMFFRKRADESNKGNAEDSQRCDQQGRPVQEIVSSMRFHMKRPGRALIFVFTCTAFILALMYRTSFYGETGALHPFFDPKDSQRYAGCHYLHGQAQSIFSLEDTVQAWQKASTCRGLYKKFSAIYRVSTATSDVVVKEPFLAKVQSWLPGVPQDQFQRQKIISVLNKYTYEQSIINPTRSKRPGITARVDLDNYINDLVEKSSKNCDFCQYSENTAENSFGRIESKYTYTAANVFPFDGFHGVIIFKNHHPLHFTLDEFLDAMSVARRWMKRAHGENSNYKYPHLTWDCLPKGSTSQVHSHAQVTLNSISHYGQMQLLTSAALKFEKDFPGESYFQTLFEIHRGLNLSVCLGDAKAFTLITPKKDDDIFVIAQKPTKDFYSLLYHVLRAYIDEMKLYAWSMVIFFPTLDSFGSWDEGSIPVVARLISRGPPDIQRSDISSLELFAASNVNTDPFKVIPSIKKSLRQDGIDSQC
ncbi:uncharacterized protein [Apostichopus japonicus]|uniref:uncharacterized protein isoform X2 n=1 Tax=Stichopus japonicus TaxID=307972 RepID=UPI003AB6DF97